MASVVKTRVIKIGNSHGVRIPKLLLDQSGIGGEVEIEAQEDQIVIRPAYAPRDGWEEQFAAMHRQGDDRLVDEEQPPTVWDDEEWQW
ncbi:MAG TPA: AbrB/MazE/SpoVT family DNA-binding domain-containing protein [Armatimonadota bacterium]|nr:AbrB/MazE/SpoVT family DNA-binding domain-containing protein [Armatimonadota bacterium]